MKHYGIFSTHSLDRYDAVEVHPVEIQMGCCTPITTDEVGRDNNCVYVWSVYLHYNRDHIANEGFGGIECVADLPTRKSAEAYAEGLRAALYELLERKHSGLDS